jgi:hypothetical protein
VQWHLRDACIGKSRIVLIMIQGLQLFLLFAAGAREGEPGARQMLAARSSGECSEMLLGPRKCY